MGQLLEHWRPVWHGVCVLWAVYVPGRRLRHLERRPAAQRHPVTPDGACGGAEGYRCSHDWGMCSNVNGVCAENPANCYLDRGCQPAFGICESDPSTACVQGVGEGGKAGLCTRDRGGYVDGLRRGAKVSGNPTRRSRWACALPQHSITQYSMTTSVHYLQHQMHRMTYNMRLV
jgi:hypothetical protein